MTIALRDVVSAAEVLAGRVVRTPLIYSPALQDELGLDVWFKPEQWQLTGSFKIRGAYHKMARLSPEERRRGVIAASAGNHAQGVALAGQRLGVSVLVVVPESAPETKIAGIRQYGAEVVVSGSYYDEAEQRAQTLSKETGRLLVHAFEDARVIAGQGTVGLEMLTDRPDLDTLVVPAGGGGLIVGIGVVARAMSPAIRVLGVQSEASPAWHAAWQAGRVVEVTYHDTWADGLLGAIGQLNFALAQSVVDDFVLVSESEIREAMLWALKQHHWVIEGSAAVGLAYALHHAPDLRGRRVGIVLTGGNLDLARLRALL